MNRVIYSLVAAVLTIGLSACDTKSDPQNNDNANDSEFRFETISVSENAISVKIAPRDTAKTYISMYATKENYDIMFDSLGSESAVIADDIAYLKENITFYREALGYDVTLADFLSIGADTLNITNIEPATEYVVWAYYLDTLYNNSGKIYTCTLKSADIAASSAKFDIVSEGDSLFHLTVSDTTQGWVSMSELKTTVDEAGGAKAYLQTILDNAKAADLLDWVTFHGNYDFTLAELNLGEAGTYQLMVAPVSISGKINGDVVIYEFDYAGSSEAAESVIAKAREKRTALVDLRCKMRK